MLHFHHNYIEFDENLMNISGHRLFHKTSFVFLLSAGCQITGRLSGIFKIFKLVKLVEEVVADYFLDLLCAVMSTGLGLEWSYTGLVTLMSLTTIRIFFSWINSLTRARFTV